MKISIAACVLFFALTGVANADNSGPWTLEQVQKLCHYRAEKDAKNPKRYSICMGNHTGKNNVVGRAKRRDNITELNAADAILAKSGAAPTTVKAPVAPTKPTKPKTTAPK